MEWMPEYAPWAFFLIALPFGLIATYTDLRYMKILNTTVIGLTIAFVITGVIFLPFTEYLLRLLAGFLVLVATFLLFQIGAIGGGDAKFAAAMAMFVQRHEVLSFLLILSIITLLVVSIHWLVGKLSFAKPLTDKWDSWSDDRKFPMGFGFGLSLIYYLAVPLFGLPA